MYVTFIYDCTVMQTYQKVITKTFHSITAKQNTLQCKGKEIK